MKGYGEPFSRVLEWEQRVPDWDVGRKWKYKDMEQQKVMTKEWRKKQAELKRQEVVKKKAEANRKVKKMFGYWEDLHKKQKQEKSPQEEPPVSERAKQALKFNASIGTFCFKSILEQ